MARQLRTFQTSIGFYDLAVAAPSMKAALEAWGAGSNLFHQGLASESDDPAVVGATMAKPGVVLKRPVGSRGRFAEHADLPDLSDAKTAPRRKERAKPKAKSSRRKTDDKVAREAAQKFEREEKRREAERKREEAARAKERERRNKAVAKAQAELDRAREDHEAEAASIEADRAAVEQRFEDERARWEKQEAKLRAALRKAQQSR